MLKSNSPFQKPDFDRQRYLESKTHFNLHFNEPFSHYNEVVEDEVVEDTFKVNYSMYQLILAGGSKYFSDHPHPNARYGNGIGYIFGRLYNLKEYKFINSHNSNAGYTGFLDNDLTKQFKNLHYYNKDPCGYEDPFDMFSDYKYYYPSFYKTIRGYYPQVIWISKNEYEHDGANLYVHYDKQNEINSIIVDVGYFFGEEEEDYIDKKLKSIVIDSTLVPSILSHPDFKPAP